MADRFSDEPCWRGCGRHARAAVAALFLWSTTLYPVLAETAKPAPAVEPAAAAAPAEPAPATAMPQRPAPVRNYSFEELEDVLGPATSGAGSTRITP